MKISMVAAMANNRVIGKGNQMPWHLPADLKHFKSVTLGKPVIMGRKTYESIGKALPGRQNVVISRDVTFQPSDALVVTSPEKALEAAEHQGEVMVIGGGSIYLHFLPLCHRLYLTDIELDTDGDTQFPDFNQGYRWDLLDESLHKADDKNPYNYRFYTLEKV